MLDVRGLKVLREVAARGSFSAAADSLSFTQSAVSQHVAALERETGSTLLERGPRGIRLTDAGRALVAHAVAARKSVRLRDLSEASWIASSEPCGCRKITEHACRAAGFTPRIAFEYDETLAAQALVAAGVGVAVMPQLALSVVHPGVVALPLGPDAPVRRVWAARVAEAYRSPASEAMLQILRDVAENFGGARLERVA